MPRVWTMPSRLIHQRIRNPKQCHAEEGEEDAQIPVMVQAEALHEQLQSDARHDPGRAGKHASVRGVVDVDVGTVRNLEPENGHRSSARLAEPAEERRPHEGFETAAESHVQGQSHGEALGDVVNKERHEHVEAELGTGMVRGVGDETLGELVQRDGDDGL